ncbi:MAG TPA: hypothetical protein VLO07_05695 [Thermoanaerobaculia bacterium]|nr:hypothetical protein [Thermoanaerobaculia bacterium]
MAGKGKKTGRKKTRGATRKRVKKTAKKAAARGRRRAKKAPAARPGASKRTARKRPGASQKRASVAPSTPVPALAGEMYGEADWRADDEGGPGLAPLRPEEDAKRRLAEEDQAEGAEQRSEDDTEW